MYGRDGWGVRGEEGGRKGSEVNGKV